MTKRGGRVGKQRDRELTDKQLTKVPRYWSQAAGAHVPEPTKLGGEMLINAGEKVILRGPACCVTFLRISPGFQKQPLAQGKRSFEQLS